jgi:hypothetical protein
LHTSNIGERAAACCQKLFRDGKPALAVLLQVLDRAVGPAHGLLADLVEQR